MAYTKEQLLQLQSFYTTQLLNDTVPFWFPRSFDQEQQGFLLMRDRDGSLLDDDKAVWIQGRATWLLATLYNTVEPKKRMARRRGTRLSVPEETLFRYRWTDVLPRDQGWKTHP